MAESSNAKDPYTISRLGVVDQGRVDGAPGALERRCIFGGEGVGDLVEVGFLADVCRYR